MAGLSDIYTPSEIMAMMFPQTSAYRPDLPRPVSGQFDRVKDFGPRWSENAQNKPMTSLKGYGWLGLMPSKSGNVMSEFSGSSPIDPRDLQKGFIDYPQVTPTLNSEEIKYLLNEPGSLPSIPTRARAIDDSIYKKANRWASLRGLQGLSPFID